MKISESWLREWVNPALTSEQLAAQLTMAGLAVDAMSPVAGRFDHVVVARVLSVRPHPQADKLTLCEVDAGEGRLLAIVCGAQNVRAHLTVALALPGAHLPGDVVIKESRLRGELSQGMLCSSTELGMGETSEGIIELPDDAPIGTALAVYLSLNDVVFDLDLTPNRADCFSVLGVARDVAAMNALELTPWSVSLPKIDSTSSLSVDVLCPEACPNYCAIMLRDINPDAQTPLWMKEKLRRAGIRAIHPVVDVTQYVMMECGQPLHAFDLSCITKGLVVRYAQQDEALILLDGQEITLDPQTLVIADADHVLALAGVMGGLNSAVSAETKDLVLESAFFHPLHMAGVARRYKLCTDASQRFERGVDPTLPARALARALELLVSIVGGTPSSLTSVLHEHDMPASKTILFHPRQVKKLSGLDIDESKMYAILEHLGMQVARDESVWRVSVPAYRFDLALDVDLVEEILRVHGYDHIPASMPVVPLQAGEQCLSERLQLDIGRLLSHRGYHESISYSFVDPQIQEALYPETHALTLLNPISHELSVMRVGLWPGLLASMLYNLDRQHTMIKLFECGVVFDLKDNQRKERACVAGLISGCSGTLQWCDAIQAFDFYDLKGDVQALLHTLACTDVKFLPGEHLSLHPGKSARLMIHGEEMGWLGALHPRLQEALDLKDEVFLFELNINELQQHESTKYQKISKYPHMRRDLSLLVPQAVSAGQIEQAVFEVAGDDCLTAFHVFDVYTGAPIPATHKSIAVALVFQREQRTLVDTEVNLLIDAILKKLDVDFSIALRTE